MAYDRRLGGWRGPVTHIDNPVVLDRDWPTLLAKVPRKPGMLPTWQLAVVLSTSDNEARVGWLSGLGVRGGTPQPNLGAIPMSDVAWARPLHGDELGADAETDHRRDAGRRRRDDRAGAARGGRQSGEARRTHASGKVGGKVSRKAGPGLVPGL
jgi:hypothetical protein